MHQILRQGLGVLAQEGGHAPSACLGPATLSGRNVLAWCHCGHCDASLPVKPSDLLGGFNALIQVMRMGESLELLGPQSMPALVTVRRTDFE